MTTVDVQVHVREVERSPAGIVYAMGQRSIPVRRDELVAAMVARRPDLTAAEIASTVDRWLAGEAG